jgi:hypothetical protein
MDITEQIMIGIQASKNKLCPATFPKAICKKLTGTSKDEKYVDSMRDWCQGYYRVVVMTPGGPVSRRVDLEPNWAPVILKNDPIIGHEIVGFQSRSRTDNKWFEVRDPRGFTLEINASTMVSLMKDNIINHGVVQLPCIWGYAHSPMLVSFGGKTYQEFLDAKTKKEALVKVTVKGLEVGKTYLSTSFGSETPYVFLGRANVKVNLNIGRGGYSSTKEDRSANNLFLFGRKAKYRNGWDYVLKKSLPKLYQTADQCKVTVKELRQDMEKQQSFEYPASLLKDTGYNRDLKLVNFDCDDIGMTITN